MSVYTTIFTGTSPFGALLASGIASGIGTPGSIAICGAATAGAAILVALLGRSAGVPIQPPRPQPAALEAGD
jgi:hypothetical protein